MILTLSCDSRKVRALENIHQEQRISVVSHRAKQAIGYPHEVTWTITISSRCRRTLQAYVTKGQASNYSRKKVFIYDLIREACVVAGRLRT